jgi:hypothetical protein
MKIAYCILAAAASVSLLAVASASEPLGRREPARLMSPQQLAVLRQEASKVACGPAKSIAASVYNKQFGADGTETLVQYDQTVTNEGGGWITSSNTFIAPCAGLYEFSASFVTDSFYPCPSVPGTLDDVYVIFKKSTPPLYDDPTTVGDPYGAYRGQMHTANDRGTGVYSFFIRLNAKDAMQTVTYSDGQASPVCLRPVNFSAHRTNK